jgi:hypothetical protein
MDDSEKVKLDHQRNKSEIVNLVKEMFKLDKWGDEQFRVELQDLVTKDEKGNETSNVSVKVQCTGCKRITTVRIPSDKTIEKWNEKATCSLCGGKSCWEKYV